MQTEYYYELTGNKGKSLFDSLRESDYDRLVRDQAEYCINRAGPGGRWRYTYIGEHLRERLSEDDLDSITDKVPELKGKETSEIQILGWLHKNKCPIIDEEEDIREWAWRRAYYDVRIGLLWDHTEQYHMIDTDDDAEAALGFGLIKYPEFVDGKYIDNGNTDTTIPAGVANKIRELNTKNATEEKKKQRRKKNNNWRYPKMSRLEKEAVEKLILVSGFHCGIHGGKIDFEQPIPKRDAEVLTCPSCGHPICPD